MNARHRWRWPKDFGEISCARLRSSLRLLSSVLRPSEVHQQLLLPRPKPSATVSQPAALLSRRTLGRSAPLRSQRGFAVKTLGLVVAVLAWVGLVPGAASTLTSASDQPSLERVA